MMRNAEITLLQWAQQQCGVFSRAQVVAAVARHRAAVGAATIGNGRTGSKVDERRASPAEAAAAAATAQPSDVWCADELIRRRLSERRWVRLVAGVYGDAFRPATFDRRLWIAVLAVGEPAAVSHEAAAACWGFDVPGRSVGTRAIVLTTHGNHRRLKHVKVRQTTNLPPSHLTTLRRLPITTPERTVVDLAGTVPAAAVGSLLDEALITKVVALPKVSKALAVVAARGRRGVVALGAAIDERSGGAVPPSSHLERLLRQAVASAGLPPLAWQHPFPGRREVGSCVDGAHVAAKLIVEVDGRRWHTRIADLQRDHARDREAASAGWLTLRLLWEDVAPDVAAAGQEIAGVVDVRLRQLAAAGTGPA